MGKRRLGAALGVGRPRFPEDNVIATARASRRRWSTSGFRPCRRPHRPPRDGTPRALRRGHGESGPFGETGGEWVVDRRRPCQDNRFGQPRGGNAASWVVGARHAARTGGSSDPETSGCYRLRAGGGPAFLFGRGRPAASRPGRRWRRPGPRCVRPRRYAGFRSISHRPPPFPGQRQGRRHGRR